MSICAGSLPLSADSSLKVAVIGPNSNATETMQGNYHVSLMIKGPPMSNCSFIFVYVHSCTSMSVKMTTVLVEKTLQSGL